jgi:dUTP pyrophosphatase
MNDKVELKIKRLTTVARVPKFAHSDDACFDIYAGQDVVVPAKGYATVNTGIASEIPVGYEVVIRPRSGMAFNYGIQVHPGTIDSGYRGEWLIQVYNHSHASYLIKTGDRIAQGALRPVPQVEIAEVEKLADSERGERGIGSTGD